MKSIVKSLMLFSVLGCFSACYYDNPPGDIPIAIENVSFNRDIVPIFSSSCMGEGCHSGAHEPTLTPDAAYTSLQGVDSHGELFVNITLPEQSPIYLEVKSGEMPPTGALGKVEIEFIKAWIQKGALND